MESISPIDLARWCSGEWKNGVPSTILGLANDTRKIVTGQLFAALRTTSRDGHDFLESARSNGAAGAIVEEFRAEVAIPQLLVKDVGTALLAAARGFRETWKSKVVGITGSCGKTTCKNLLSHLLSGYATTLSTVGNLNNLIGVPMSILRPEAAKSKFAVLEAGISEPGEMEKLAHAIDPDFGIVTAIGAAHLRDLGTVETIASEKGALLRKPRLQRAFVGETCTPFLKEMGGKRVTVVKPDRYLSVEWSYRFENAKGMTLLQQRIGGSVQTFEFEGLGAGLASNAALALATAFSLGMDVEPLRDIIASWKPSHMRNEWLRVGDSILFVDCYNANPVSMHDSLATFVANTPEELPRFFLIGCMEELGSQASRLHWELGRDLPLRKQDFLLVIGSEAQSVLRGMKDAGCEMDRSFEIAKVDEASSQLARFSGSIFLKGSRRYRLEDAIVGLAGESDSEGGSSC